MNISSVAVDTQEASQQLTTAAEYQRRSGRRAACLLLILAVVAGVVLLAVSFHQAGSFGTADPVLDDCLDSLLTGIPTFYFYLTCFSRLGLITNNEDDYAYMNLILPIKFPESILSPCTMRFDVIIRLEVVVLRINYTLNYFYLLS